MAELYADKARAKPFVYGFMTRARRGQRDDLARAWARRELPRRGIGYEVRVLANHTVEVWCTVREVRDGRLGELLKLWDEWDDPEFRRHLSESFAKEVNKALRPRLGA